MRAGTSDGSIRSHPLRPGLMPGSITDVAVLVFPSEYSRQDGGFCPPRSGDHASPCSGAWSKRLAWELEVSAEKINPNKLGMFINVRALSAAVWEINNAGGKKKPLCSQEQFGRITRAVRHARLGTAVLSLLIYALPDWQNLLREGPVCIKCKEQREFLFGSGTLRPHESLLQGRCEPACSLRCSRGVDEAGRRRMAPQKNRENKI